MRIGKSPSETRWMSASAEKCPAMLLADGLGKLANLAAFFMIGFSERKGRNREAPPD